MRHLAERQTTGPVLSHDLHSHPQDVLDCLLSTTLSTVETHRRGEWTHKIRLSYYN